MATGKFFHNFFLAEAEKKHNLNTDTLKLALSNVAPTLATDAVFADITEIASGNGYSAGGAVIDNQTLTLSSGKVTLDSDNEVITASGGSIGPFRYVILYNDTATNDELIGRWDLLAEQTITDGQSLNFNIPATGIATKAEKAA